MTSSQRSPEEDSNRPGRSEAWKTYREFAPYLALGFQLAAAVVLFFLLGAWLDEKLGVSPLLKLLGLLVGMIGGFVKFFRTVAQLEKRKQNASHRDKP